MHSRIYQFSKTPIAKEEYFTDEKAVELNGSNMLGNYFDYVELSTDDRQGDMDYLKACVPYSNLIDVDNEKITFKPGFLKEYAEKKYQNFIKLSTLIKPEEFMKPWSSAVNLVSDVLSPDFQIHVILDGVDMPIEYFITSQLSDLPEDQEATYYIGGVLDYHW